MESSKVKIELPVEAWNVVMNALGQRPFAEVAGVIAEMRKQADDQVKSDDQSGE